MKQIIETSKAPAPIGPYSQAVRAGNTLYISGQIALDPQSGVVEKGAVEEQTRRVMQNLQAILQEAGLDFDHVVKCSIFLSNMELFPRVNEVYGSYFKKDPPARETVAVAGLPKGVDVEISAIAVF